MAARQDKPRPVNPGGDPAVVPAAFFRAEGTQTAAGSSKCRPADRGAAAASSTSTRDAVASGHAAALGTVTGRFLLEGGPIGPDGQQPRNRPIAGSVRFKARTGRATEVRVGKSGTFSISLPPGRYHVSGRSPSVIQVSNGADIGADGQMISGTKHELPCSQPLSVTVTAGRTAKIAVTCIVP